MIPALILFGVLDHFVALGEDSIKVILGRVSADYPGVSPIVRQVGHGNPPYGLAYVLNVAPEAAASR